MKTKLSAIIILFFLMACDSGENTSQGEKQAEEAKQPEMKFILKASNNNFVALTADFALVANQTEAGKAEVFEKIDLGGGKCSFKASNGKFITDDRSKNSQMFANRDANGEWETFEVVNLDSSSVNIKTSAGKFVSCDQSKNDIFYADRDQANDWEKFVLVKQ
jgi:hypothetical protein